MGGSSARLTDVTVEFSRGDGFHRVLDGFNLALAPGRTTCLLGPSGYGKTTILNLFAGFLTPLSGNILINDVLDPPPGPDRGVVFQRHSLFPWMTVRENIEFGLRMQKVSRESRRTRVGVVAKQMGIDDVLDELPSVLSGGMEQRVGLARVFINEPEILLLDEPFSSLDALTAERARAFLRLLLGREQITTLLVTHDVDEALNLADRVLAINGTPAEVVLDLELPTTQHSDRRDDPRWLTWRRSLLDSLEERDNGKERP